MPIQVPRDQGYLGGWERHGEKVPGRVQVLRLGLEILAVQPPMGMQHWAERDCVQGPVRERMQLSSPWDDDEPGEWVRGRADPEQSPGVPAYCDYALAVPIQDGLVGVPEVHRRPPCIQSLVLDEVHCPP